MYRAECERCKYSQTFAEGGLRSYQLPGEVRITIRQQLGWCRSCDRVVFCEELPTMGELAIEFAQFEELVRQDFDFLSSPGMSAEELIERERSRLASLADMLQARQSPPRCLECGSTSIIPISEADENEEEAVLPTRSSIEHPGCGGPLSVHGIGLSRSRLWTIYSTEGERLGAYEMLPYGGAVPLNERNTD